MFTLVGALLEEFEYAFFAAKVEAGATIDRGGGFVGDEIGDIASHSGVKPNLNAGWSDQARGRGRRLVRASFLAVVALNGVDVHRLYAVA